MRPKRTVLLKVESGVEIFSVRCAMTFPFRRVIFVAVGKGSDLS